MLLSLFNKFKGWIMGVGVVLTAILAVYLKGRADGSENAEEDAREAVRKDVEDYEEIKDRVGRMSDDELDSKLREWSRKR